MNSSIPSTLKTVALSAILLVLASGPVHAQTTWLGGADLKWSNASIADDPEDAGKTVLRWTGAGKGGALATVPAEKDWSGCNALSFRMFANEADGHDIMVVCQSDPEGMVGNYYSKKIRIDWKGWKTITIPFKSFGKDRSPIGWNCITRFLIHSKGWEIEPNPHAEYYIDAVKTVGVAK